MTTVPLGIGAYERVAAGVPEIVLRNRYAEVAPTNLREHVMLLARAATTPTLTLNPGAFNAPNLLRWSNDLTQAAAWANAAVEVIAGGFANPLTGATDAQKWTVSTSSNRHRFAQTTLAGNTISNAVYNFSFYAKANGYQFIRAAIQDSSGGSISELDVDFDLVNGLVATPPFAGIAPAVPVGASITSVGGGWYRCTLAGSVTLANPLRASVFAIQAAAAGVKIGSLPNWVGDGVSGFFTYGFQLTQGSGVQPYTGTSGTLPLTALGSMRGNYFFGGLFDDSLFVVCGNTLFRIHPDLTVTQIVGVLQGTGHPEVAWQKGIGYERLFISDGLLLQFYGGTTSASGTLTLTGTITNGVDIFQIGGVFYTWGVAFTGSDNGSAAHPFVVAPLTDALGQLVKAIKNSGIPGVDYSATIAGPNTQVTAVENGGPPGTSVTFTALSAGTAGNAITSVVTGGTHLAFGAATLLNGGIDALQGVTVPDGVAVESLTQVSSFVLVSVAGTQKFFWIKPGAIVIDPLDFADKESSPDAIVAMRATGDQAVIMGEVSTENWYATGNDAAPFLPIEGRVYQHGAIPGTPCIVANSVMLVGDDGVAYQIDSGSNRISNHGVEERIRRQIRREKGLTP